MAKVIGIGGVFFKCESTEKVKEWYASHLGMKTDQYGSMFESRNIDEPDTKEYLQWSPFDQKTEYFRPSEKEYMINYRVDDLEELKKELEAKGVEILDEIAEYEYGKFLHIMGPEGQKLELWEAPKNAFEES